MSWSPKNLYNLWQRTIGPKSEDILFKDTAEATLFQQRWKSKAAARAYHGDYIPEKVFKRWYLPDNLPDVRPRRQILAGDNLDLKLYAKRKLKEKKLEEEIEDKGMAPVGSLMFCEVERRIDTVVFRSCFAHSIYEARRLVIHGNVMLNGKKHPNPATRLAPGDMISVNPQAIRFFKPPNGQSDDVNGKEGRTNQTEDKPGKSDEKQASPEPQATSAPETNLNKPLDESKPDAENTSENSLDSDRAPQTTSASEPEVGEVVNKDVEAASKPDAENTSESSLDSERAPQTTSTSEPEVGEVVDKDVEAASEISEPQAQAAAVTKSKKEDKGPSLTPFHLPLYAAPWLFIPAYIEPSFATCSAVYVRHPTARPGYSEIPTPYDADGALLRYAWEWYVQRRSRVRSKTRLSRMPEDRTKIPRLDVGEERKLLLMDIKPERKPGYHIKDARKYSDFGEYI